MKIKGSVALVTGGAKRLGRSIVLELAKQGASVAIHYLSSRTEAEKTLLMASGIGAPAAIFKADLRRKDEAQKLIKKVRDRFGTIDILINNASVFSRTPSQEITEADWEEGWRLHTLAPFWLSRSVAQGIKKRGAGKIINIVDRAVFRPMRNYIPYSVTKGALAALTRSLAVELAPKIQVNAIAPGILLRPEGVWGKARKRLTAKIPLGRIGTPDDLARAVVALIENDFITGTTLCLDGGESL